jgi:hypothetical protein
MKNKNNIFNMGSLLLLCLLFTMFNACDKDDNESFEKTRLFRPVLNSNGLTAVGNTIFIDMASLKNAVGYIVEVSRDTFATIEYTITSDNSYVVIDENTVGEELFWNTLYQVRATALESDAEYNSRISDLGNVLTETFPSILNAPKAYDVTDVAARVTWDTVNTGLAVTGIKVYAADDLKLKTPLFDETPVTIEESDAGEAFVQGLDPETTYQIAIYSGDELRGWVDYVTRVALPSGDHVIDLRGNEDPLILKQTLESAPEGSLVLLEKGMIYDMSQPPTLQRSVEVRGAYGFTPEYATIEMGLHKGFNVDPAGLDYVKFNEVAIKGPYDGSFLFYITNNASIGEISYENCKIGPLRGGLRINTEGNLDKFTFNNSVVDSIKDFNFVFLQKAGWKIGDLHISNSTFSNVGSSFIRNSNGNDMGSITIESSTLYQVAHTGRTIFEWGGNAGVIPGNITIKDNIWGRGWNTGGGDDYSIKGLSGLDNVSFSLSNNWGTSELIFSSSEIPGFPDNSYSGTTEALWVDPENGNFKFLDKGFPGRTSAGDPRWRLQF